MVNIILIECEPVNIDGSTFKAFRRGIEISRKRMVDPPDPYELAMIKITNIVFEDIEEYAVGERSESVEDTKIMGTDRCICIGCK